MIIATEAVPKAVTARDEKTEKRPQPSETLRSQTIAAATARKPTKKSLRDVEAKRSGQKTEAPANGLKRERKALISRISRFSLEPDAEGYRRLDTQEIKVIFKDAYIEHYPGHWQIEFSANGKWEGLLSNWNVTEGYGTWTARDGMHCIKVEGRSRTWADTDEQGCYQVWINEEAGNIRMIDPTVVSAWVLAKENAFGEIAQLRNTISNEVKPEPNKFVAQ